MPRCDDYQANVELTIIIPALWRLGVSTELIARVSGVGEPHVKYSWATGQTATNPANINRLKLMLKLAAMVQRSCGDGYAEAFFTRPVQALGSRSPLELLADEAVDLPALMVLPRRFATALAPSITPTVADLTPVSRFGEQARPYRRYVHRPSLLADLSESVEDLRGQLGFSYKELGCLLPELSESYREQLFSKLRTSRTKSVPVELVDRVAAVWIAIEIFLTKYPPHQLKQLLTHPLITQAGANFSVLELIVSSAKPRDAAISAANEIVAMHERFVFI